MTIGDGTWNGMARRGPTCATIPIPTGWTNTKVSPGIWKNIYTVMYSSGPPPQAGSTATAVRSHSFYRLD